MTVPRFMIISSFRYALGRMTYIVDETVRWMIEHIDEIDATDKSIMIREIGEEADRDRLGMECDKRQWLELKARLEESLEGE